MEIKATTSDLELIELTISGDHSAFGVLCKRYEGALSSMLTNRGVCECKDIVQESFIRAYLNLEKFDRQYSFGQWLFAIAKNLHIDIIRKQKTTTVGIEEVVTFSGALNPEQSFISKQNRDEVEKQLSDLPENYRVIVEMRFLDEMGYEEIAEKLGIPIGTVKTKIHRARALLGKGQK